MLWRFITKAVCAAAAFSLLAAPAHPGVAQNADHDAAARLTEVLDSLNHGRSFSRVAISPDGKRLAWSEDGKIHVAPYDNLQRSVLVSAVSGYDDRCSEDEFIWSPDSSLLAFLSDCAKPGQPDFYVSRADGKPARRQTSLHGYVNAPAFSPDGSSIAFLYVEGATRPAGALAAFKAQTGVIGEEGIEIQRVARISSGSNWGGEDLEATEPDRPAGTRDAKSLVPLFGFLTPPNLHVYEFDWSPDSKSLAYIAADPPGENNWWVAKLYTQSLYGPSGSAVLAASAQSNPQEGPVPAPKVILAPSEFSGPLHGLQLAVPRWSPDGSSIAFIGGLMSDQGVTGGDVWLVPATGGDPHDLTPERASSPVWIEWDGDRHLYVNEIAGGDSRLVRLELSGNAERSDAPAGAVSTVFSVPGIVSDGRLQLSLSSTADRSLFVFFGSTFDRPKEIYVARADQPPSPSQSQFAGVRQLTHFNESVKPAWGKTVSVAWTNDGFHVQGWLTLPKDFNPAKKYPLIVEVHGGPASAIQPVWGGSWELSPSYFSALGYFVLQPNPRGSYGQGEAFAQANRKDFGHGDLRDILAGVDEVIGKYGIDSNRIGITGWSYGGYMTMFATTQTNRFKAAVAGAGISDWLSYYGENSIDQWMIPYFGASVYDDPAVYAKSSPMNFIKQDHTPALLVVGDRDGECPAPQSFEYWHALRDLHVPAQLVVYPNEGHGFTDSDHTRDVLERAAEWFARYMP